MSEHARLIDDGTDKFVQHVRELARQANAAYAAGHTHLGGELTKVIGLLAETYASSRFEVADLPDFMRPTSPLE